MAWFASWLWEGVVIVLLVSAMLRGLRRVDAATRYAIWWGTLLAIICWPIVTVTRVVAQFLLSEPVSVSHLATAPRHAKPLMQVTVPTAPLWALRIALVLWLVSVVWKLSRLAVACWQLHRVKRSCAPVGEDQLAQLPLWRVVSQRGRAASLCMSDRVDVACALGFRHPIIALPRQFVDGLTARHLDQVALHEYAHVQRRDDWARLVQLAVDAVCGWHPAVRWISRQLTFEREVACDDWVVQRTHDPLGYARCLTTLAEQTVAGRVSTLSPAAWNNEADVVRRVKRVLEARRNTKRSASRWRLALAVAVVALCAGEAGRVLALQDATDRIVKATPVVGALSEATVPDVLAPPAAVALVAAADADRDATNALIAARRAPAASSALTTSTARATEAASATSATASLAAPDAAAGSASAAQAQMADGEFAPTRLTAPKFADHTRPAFETTTASTAAVSAPTPHATATDDRAAERTSAIPSSSSSIGLAPLDLTATLADMALDEDDADHDGPRSVTDEPNASNLHLRPVKTKRNSSFFARMGRGLAHIIGTHSKSPGSRTPDAWKRRA
jgi:beta-lactamase regulating signal transducer with metallopeptidase domain